MKKLLSIILTVALMITVLPFGLFNITASAATSGYYTYTVSNGEAKITDCNTSISGSVTIPSTLGGYPVTSIGNSAFSLCHSLTSITIPDSVTSIGDGAFHFCNGLTSITIPDSVTTIGDNTFSYCSSLTSITIPDSVTSIGMCAFEYCVSLTSVTIPDSVKTISIYTFEGCRSLTSITIPDSVKSIGTCAFKNCSSLKSIIMPKNLTYIGAAAFSGCTFDEIYITDLGAWCSVDYNFVPNANPFRYAKKIYLNGRIVTDLVIPKEITEIKSFAFSGCSTLTSITIPSSVTIIGDGVFNNCISLTNINVENGNAVYHSDGNCIIETETNSLVSACKNSIIPDYVTSISDYTFYDCGSLTNITIPDSVTSIGYYAFGECGILKEVYYRGSAAEKSKINIDSTNSDLANATWYYNSCIGVPEHIYDAVCDSECTVCGEIRLPIGEHKYDNECDTNCNDCGAVRTTKHKYDNDCDASCNVCAEIRVPLEHQYDGYCDSECNVCGSERVALEHQYDGDCDTKCNECGETREAQEHTYVDWIIETPAKPGIDGLRFKYCEWCGDYIEEIIPAVIMPNFKSTALALQSDLSIYYKVSDELVKAGYTNLYAEFELNGIKTVVTESVYDSENGVYIFKYSNIGPHLMNETITATLYAEYDGEVYTGNKTYSIVAYCKNQLKAFGGKTGYEKLSRLLVDILNYGAAAQNYAGYNVNNLANSFLNDTQKAYGTHGDREYISLKNFNNSTDNDTTAIINAVALKLKDSITVTFKFELNTNETLEGITAKVEAINKEWNIENGKFEYDSKTKRYAVNFKELNPSQMGEAIYITLYKNGKAISNTACYSIESYALGNAVAGNEKLAALVDAMLKYGDAAKAYVG